MKRDPTCILIHSVKRRSTTLSNSPTVMRVAISIECNLHMPDVVRNKELNLVIVEGESIGRKIEQEACTMFCSYCGKRSGAIEQLVPREKWFAPIKENSGMMPPLQEKVNLFLLRWDHHTTTTY